MTQQRIDFASHLPDEINGFKRETGTQEYTPSTLFDYIDGGAELYLSFGFSEAVVFRYVNGDAEIRVDIFGMGNSYNAFGVFVHGRESMSAEVGQGSEYVGGLLTFWKDCYFVSILGYPETGESRDAVWKLARSLAAAIPREGRLPPIVFRLPKADLIPESVRYFHHHVWLNSYCLVSGGNVLNIDEQTETALAKYVAPKGKYCLLLVEYTATAMAEKAETSFLMRVLDGRRVAKGSDGRWSGMRRTGSLVVAVLAAPDRATVEKALATMEMQR